MTSKVLGPQGVNNGCERIHREGELGFPWKQETDEPGQGSKWMGENLISAQMRSLCATPSAKPPSSLC